MLVALDNGALDLTDEGDMWRVTCEPGTTPTLEEALKESGIPVDSAEVTMLPTSVVTIATESDAKGVLRVIDALDDLDDVQDVYANFDIPDDVLQVLTS
jgi:transcriptional/translational regulatory protein YebC/TACO1